MSKFTGKHLDGSCRHWYHRDSSKQERRRQDEKKNAGDLISGVDALDPGGLREEDRPGPGAGARGENGPAPTA